MQHRSFVRVVKNVFVATLGVGAVLCLTQCVAEQGDREDLASVSQALQCGSRSCSGTADCQVNVPVCAQGTSATCLPNAPR